MATEDQIQDNSEITQTNVNNKKYLIVVIAIFGLFVGGMALFSALSKNQTDEPVAKESTSQATRDIMNKTVHTQAKENNIVNIKGHRSVGGMRASIYNAMPIEGVEALVEFMKKFAKENS